ncbi:MAG: amidohydrolase family protein [Myxococcota bacterium]
MTRLGFSAFDADHHYYEPEDAFTRHMDPKLAKRAMQWADVKGRRCLLVGGKLNRFIPNPTFDPVAKPGCLDEFFRGRNQGGKSIRDLFGALEPIHPAYRDRDARIAQLDAQEIDACFMFPTLAVGMEEALADDPQAAVAAFRAFNRWLEEDWGFAYRERIYSTPYVSLIDLDAAIGELEFALAHDARVINMRAAPIKTSDGFVSPADPRYDRFWRKVNDAGITVAYHSGDSGYLFFTEMWGGNGEFQAFDFQPKRLCLSASPVSDLMATLVCDGLFDRFRNLRVATIEQGSAWVFPLLWKLKKAYGQMPWAFQRDPLQTFAEHVWVSPYYEDDLHGLRDAIGSSHILFGSDYPHAEGLADPVSFVDDLSGFSKDEVQLIMRDNGLGLATRRPV